MFRVFCEACGWTRSVIRASASLLKTTACGHCGQAGVGRCVPGKFVGVKVVETIDDRCHAYPVERLADAERLFQERARNASEEAGKALL